MLPKQVTENNGACLERCSQGALSDITRGAAARAGGRRFPAKGLAGALCPEEHSEVNGAPWRTIPKLVSCLKKSKRSRWLEGGKAENGKESGRRGSQGCVGPGTHLAGSRPTFERRGAKVWDLHFVRITSAVVWTTDHRAQE